MKLSVLKAFIRKLCQDTFCFLSIYSLVMFKPKVMILGHSFVRRLNSDLSQNLDERASIDFKVKECSVRLFGTGGRTVKKVRQHDMRLIEKFDPDILILELGTNDLSNLSPEVQH